MHTHICVYKLRLFSKKEDAIDSSSLVSFLFSSEDVFKSCDQPSFQDTATQNSPMSSMVKMK